MIGKSYICQVIVVSPPYLDIFLSYVSLFSSTYVQNTHSYTSNNKSNENTCVRTSRRVGHTSMWALCLSTLSFPRTTKINASSSHLPHTTAQVPATRVAAPPCGLKQQAPSTRPRRSPLPRNFLRVGNHSPRAFSGTGDWSTTGR
jgi:hypothetical protein